MQFPNVQIYHPPEDDETKPKNAENARANDRANDRAVTIIGTAIALTLAAAGLVAALGVFALACQWLKWVLLG